ncbi:1-phosphofructokinase family hexose kinase [Bailinhaonella thermotolerans]|uniref:1-phosphofructokinase family hexose kinase n=1 Tax=Bailinhaonella thermotolerans TaxID=1070861 RepID=A0A3A4B9G0_9ACTN|nr:1-phosphofructokinase family hexose kinase [Bailinhaonella thermotolerans]RJL34354.1 1-phosphofructokinase family hexose kinase [Bailinhaonella thermotolerans]
MILTVTLNAALDVTYSVPSLVAGSSHRVSVVSGRGGGKGANVARVLAALGEPVTATGFIGGAVGARVANDLEAGGVRTDFVAIGGETRRSVTIMSADDGDATVFNEPGPVVSRAEWALFVTHFERFIGDYRVVVLSGSLPPGVPESAYAVLCATARAAGARVIVDADGAALRESLAAGPDVVKPNVHELARMLGRPEAAAEDGAALLASGPEAVVVSDGPRGLVAFTPGGAWRAVPSETLRGNPTGAGDAAAAALARALATGTPWPETLADAVALSASAVLTPVAGSVDLPAYTRLRPHVKVTQLMAPSSG